MRLLLGEVCQRIRGLGILVVDVDEVLEDVLLGIADNYEVVGEVLRGVVKLVTLHLEVSRLTDESFVGRESDEHGT
jgi:hypothetical protein